jgi:cyclophilin family peptidyl-prolyl cis-trans isomerase
MHYDLMENYLDYGFHIGNFTSKDLEQISPEGVDFKEEIKYSHNRKYLLTRNNSATGENGKQFVLTYNKLSAWLDRTHVVFGEVIDGHHVVDQVEMLASYNGPPDIK